MNYLIIGLFVYIGIVFFIFMYTLAEYKKVFSNISIYTIIELIVFALIWPYSVITILFNIRKLIK